MWSHRWQELSTVTFCHINPCLLKKMTLTWQLSILFVVLSESIEEKYTWFHIKGMHLLHSFYLLPTLMQVIGNYGKILCLSGIRKRVQRNTACGYYKHMLAYRFILINRLQKRKSIAVWYSHAAVVVKRQILYHLFSVQRGHIGHWDTIFFYLPAVILTLVTTFARGLYIWRT